MAAENQPNLSAALWPVPEKTPAVAVRGLVLVVSGVLLITVSAKAQIPFWPVPFTMQTFVLLVLGMCYGLRLATGTALAYLAVGAAGAPVFAAGGGLTYFSGPTGGYLVGFLLSMALMGYLGDRGWGRSAKSTVVPMLAGTAVIFLCGVTWLSYLIGFDKAIVGGFLNFVPSETAKIILAIAMVPAVWRLTDRMRDR